MTVCSRAAALFLFLELCCAAQPGPAVISAKLENVARLPDKGSIHVEIRNTGAQPITAFSIGFYQQDSNGEVIPCGGRGADMIDWSDPMPGLGLYVHMRRNWLPPNHILSFDGYPRCPNGPVPLDGIQVELTMIMFDDGNGEGDRSQIEDTLRFRRQALQERQKWIDRFTALRQAADLRLAARTLYQDLVDAAHSAEIDPDAASREGIAKPVRDELQRLALDITDWAANDQSLQNNDVLAWRITDLEQRTARLARGVGQRDIDPH